jgi:hypothetical protein
MNEYSHMQQGTSRIRNKHHSVTSFPLVPISTEPSCRFHRLVACSPVYDFPDETRSIAYYRPEQIHPACLMKTINLTAICLTQEFPTKEL